MSEQAYVLDAAVTIRFQVYNVLYWIACTVTSGVVLFAGRGTLWIRSFTARMLLAFLLSSGLVRLVEAAYVGQWIDPSPVFYALMVALRVLSLVVALVIMFSVLVDRNKLRERFLRWTP